MKRKYDISLTTIKNTMTALNFIIVIFFGTVYLIGTKYVIDHRIAREFLDRVNHVPLNPEVVYFASILLFIVLIFLMYYRTIIARNHKVLNVLFTVVQLTICFGLMYLFNMGYNGIVLLVFCDSIYHWKDSSSRWILVALIILYLVSSYEVASAVLPMNNPQAFFEIYDMNTRSLLFAIRNVLITLNILIFIGFIIMYITHQLEENEKIAKELDMIHQVNRELKNYSVAIEKMGERNERKRLAREIHDTLGHALTGIAAGVDACIVMIDIDAPETKKQLKVVAKVIRQGIGEVRDSLNKLRPGALEEQGFKGALLKLISEFTSVSHLEVELDYQLHNIDFESIKEDVLFRVIQESMTNSMRHGGATSLKIRFYQEKDWVYLDIHDNGVGATEIHYGFGLKQMVERLSVINGNVRFDGTDGFHTVAKIPIQKGEQYD